MRNRLLGRGRDSWRAGRKVTSRFGFGGRFEDATFTGDVGLLLPPLLMLLLQLMALMVLMAFFAPPGMNVQSRVQGALRVGRDWSLAAGTCQCELVCTQVLYSRIEKR
jgi:hypothetical protein